MSNGAVSNTLIEAGVDSYATSTRCRHVHESELSIWDMSGSSRKLQVKVSMVVLYIGATRKKKQINDPIASDDRLRIGIYDSRGSAASQTRHLGDTM